jgi:hypothetical protein
LILISVRMVREQGRVAALHGLAGG